MAESASLGWVAFFASLMMFVIGWGIILFMVSFRRRMIEKGRQIQALEMENKILSFQAAAEAEERERERIANNLHDEISIKLTVHKQGLENLVDDLAGQKVLAAKLNAEIDTIEHLREAINGCASDLVPRYLMKKGLIASLEDQVMRINVNGLTRATFTSSGGEETEDTFSKQKLLNIYRICLELINNVIKHTAPEKMVIRLNQDKEKLVIDFDHDGKKISSREVAAKMAAGGSGLGLRSIHARSLLLNGSVNYAAANGPAITFTVQCDTGHENESPIKKSDI